MKFCNLFEIAEYDVFIVADLLRAFSILHWFDVELHHQRQITTEFLFSFDELANNGSGQE